MCWLSLEHRSNSESRLRTLSEEDLLAGSVFSLRGVVDRCRFAFRTYEQIVSRSRILSKLQHSSGVLSFVVRSPAD